MTEADTLRQMLSADQLPPPTWTLNWQGQPLDLGGPKKPDLSGYSTEQLVAMLGEHTTAPQQGVPNPDSALGGTLNIAGFDTGIKIPPAVEAGLVSAGKTAARLVQGVRQALPGDNTALDKQVAEENRLYQPLAQAHPAASAIGESLPYLATGNPLVMGALAATEYGTPAERVTRAGFAYGGGKLGQGVARLFGPASMASRPNTLASDFFADAPNKWGIPLSVGQASGNKMAQIAESVLSNLPFGGAVNDARAQTFGAFNRAISNTFGENSTTLSPELLGGALDRSGQQIGDVMSRAAVQLDKPLAQDIAHVSSLIPELDDSAGNIVNRKVTGLLGNLEDGGTLTGDALRKFDSSLGRIIGNTDNGDLRFAIGDLQDAVREAANRSLSPADQAALATARAQNFNVRQVADATKSLPDFISPKGLLSQVNKYQRRARYGGGNDLAELAQFGASALPEKIPNSGTPQRLFIQKLLTSPISTVGGVGAGLYGADQAGLLPEAATAVPLVYLASRGLAGKPVSDLTRTLLTRGGGLLGYQASGQ